MHRALVLPLALCLSACPELGGIPSPASEPDGGDPDDTPPDAGSSFTGEDGGSPDPDGDDAGVVTEDPWVRFVEPADGAQVANPVRFRIAAGGGVDEVEIFADETWSLGPAWDPRDHDDLVYRFAGTDVERSLVVVARSRGAEVARTPLHFTPLAEPCDERFFVESFDRNNEDPTGQIDLAAIRESSLAALRAQIDALEACGASVTLGGMTALLLWESALRVGAYNTRCEENSYNRTETDCDADHEALYSYQLGLGALHTSNIHPCRGGAWTAGMRQRLLDAAAAAGFPTGDDLVTDAEAARFHEVCPDATPNAVDHWILGAHDVFGIPRDDAGNFLGAFGAHPLMTPSVSIELAFAEIAASCGQIGDDRDAITAFGGADERYGDAAMQDRVLESWTSYECP